MEVFLKQLEYCLFTFRFNINNINRLNQDKKFLMSVNTMSYEYDKKSRPTRGSPVENIADKIISLERKIKRLKLKIAPVLQLYFFLVTKGQSKKDFSLMYDILWRYYFFSEHVKTVIKELRISRSTFWRKRKKLLEIFREKFFKKSETKSTFL